MALTRGKIVAQEGALEGLTVDFMFNPTEYSVRKTNVWNFQSKRAGNVPEWDFGGGGPRELQVELLFDTTLPRSGPAPSVREAAGGLFAMMAIDRSLAYRSGDGQLGRPPRCLLLWGRDTPAHFERYLADCVVRYLMFSEEGVPIRATATLTLKEVRDPDDLPRQNPTSGGDAAWATYRVIQGDRLDWVAYVCYGDAAAWKRIAEANGLEDALDIRPGMVLKIPPRLPNSP